MTKSKKRILFPLLIVLVLLTGTLLASCSAFSSDGKTDPRSVIENTYGNQTYKINFSSTTLTTPITSMEYTARSIPKLPTPERAGYVFQGWYYDANFLTPYSEDSLYMKMSDVTLYAKWVDEQIVNNGIYGVNCEFNVVRESLQLTDYAKEHGYGNLNDYLVDGEVYMEKADDGLFLRFQFDSGYQSTAEMFSFTISKYSSKSSLYSAQIFLPIS